MRVTVGSVDVTTYFALRLQATGLAATGLLPADMDLQYVRFGAAPSAKVDATALAATNTAHTDNMAIEIDATDQPGLYRVDWPDAAFASGVFGVVLTVKCTTAFTEHLLVEFQPSVDAILDLPDGVEIGLTLRQDLRLLAAACAGKASGLDTTTAVYRNAVADAKNRITATVDADGNRTAIVYDLT